MSMRCPNCGRECPDGTKFCVGCGSPLPAEGTGSSQQQNNQNAYQQQYNQNAYQQQNPYQQGGMAPIGHRSIALCIILTIVTCGLYGIYWFISMVNDLNAASDHPSDTSGGMVFLLSLITCNIYNLFWMYKAGEKVAYIKQKNSGIQESNSGIVYLLLSIFGFGIVAWALIQSELNKVATY